MNSSQTLLACILIFATHFDAHAAEFYVSAKATSAGDGSFQSPWRSLAEGLRHLQPGDTLFLRGGTYYESDISLGLKGTADARIVIRSYPNERASVVCMDRRWLGGLPGRWKRIDESKRVYKIDLPGREACMAWLNRQGQLLWRYSTSADLLADPASGRYCGPGIFQKGKELYLRLASDKPDGQFDSELEAGLASGNSQVRDALTFTTGESVLSLDECAHIEIADIDFHGGTFAGIQLTEQSRHVTIQGCTFRFCVYGVVVQEQCKDIRIVACKFDNGFPDDARWGDIKNGDPPPLEEFNACALAIENSRRVTVERCCFIRCFQAISMDATELVIRDNRLLRPHEAMLISPTTTAEIVGNVVLHALEGLALVGGTGGKKPGRVAFHHNIVDLSGLRYVERNGNFGDFDRSQTTGWDLIGSHDCDESCEKAVFLIYNNTIIGGGRSAEEGWHADGTPLRSPYERHIEYNNIYLSFGDGLLNRPAGQSAGNVLWQTNGNRLQAEPHGLVVDPQIEISKWFKMDVESSTIEDLRRCYLPKNEAVFSAGMAYESEDWPGTQQVNYRGAVPPMQPMK